MAFFYVFVASVPLAVCAICAAYGASWRARYAAVVFGALTVLILLEGTIDAIQAAGAMP